MTLSTQEKLAKIREAICYALWQHEGGGTAYHNHWSGKVRDMLPLITELQEELKPKEIDVQKVADIIASTLNAKIFTPPSLEEQLTYTAGKIIAEIERQRR